MTIGMFAKEIWAWIVALLTQYPWAILLTIIGLVAWRWAWHQSKKIMMLGGNWWKITGLGILIAIALLWVVLIIIQLAPWYGRTFLETGKTSLERNNTPVLAPGNPVVQPTPTTQAAGQSYATPMATQAGSTTFGQPGQYVISHSSGTGTLRAACTSTAEKLGEIPNGTVVTVTQFVDSNCVDGVCKRAMISPLSGYPKGGCIHASTLKVP